jgi:hypothetical protein
LPSLADIVDFVARTAERYMRDWASRYSLVAGGFEVFVFGWCPVKRELEAYLIAPSQISGTFRTNSNKIALTDAAAIGAGADEFRQRLAQFTQNGEPWGRTARLPLVAVESLVEDATRDDVGGSIQLALATRAGVRFFARCSPIVKGQPAAVIRFLGVDTYSLNTVGDCRIGMPAMA